MTKEQILQKHFTAEFGHDGHGEFMQYILDAMEEYAQHQVKNLNIPDVICSPILAKIEHINDLGKSTWYEVVYYDDKWYSYSGSKTFEDGEQVVKWRYCKDCC